MTDHTHLSQKKLSRYLADPQSLSESEHHHLTHCSLCTDKITAFSLEIQAAAQTLRQNTEQQQRTRRRFWNSIEPQQKQAVWFKQRTFIGFSLCVLCTLIVISLATENKTQPVLAIQENSQGLIQETPIQTLVAFISPETELAEPTTLSFILPPDQETTSDGFEEFIFFITPLEQEQSS